jgi:hypothetical protein
MNGHYDHLLGGGITFHDNVRGSQNLPSSHSLVIQNTATRYFVQGDSFADATLIIGGADGTGLIYSGQWTFATVPEPATISQLLTGAGILSIWRCRKMRG